MKNKLKVLSITLLCSIVFCSCEKEQPNKCVLPSPSISATNSVISGESIRLNTSTILNSTYSYNWSGPNGFQSNLQNPVIINATTTMAGDYTLKISKGICESEPVITNVKVITNTVNCSQTNNTATFTNGVSGSSNLYYNSNRLTSNNEYLIYGSSNNFEVDVTFFGSQEPVTGVYSIVSNSTPLSSGKVHVKTTYSNVVNYFAKSGDLLVSYDASNKAIIKFCNVPFSLSTNSSTDTTGSCKFTVNQ